MERALGCDPAEFGDEAAWRIAELGSLADQQVAGTKRVDGRCAASQIASASAASFFYRFTNGFT
jgi:hypothetical protein